VAPQAHAMLVAVFLCSALTKALTDDLRYLFNNSNLKWEALLGSHQAVLHFI
jgi:hypothetical protein